MKQLKDWFVPWLMTAREYNVSILDKAWASPEYARLMLNENPVPPSEKVVSAVTEAVRSDSRERNGARADAVCVQDGTRCARATRGVGQADALPRGITPMIVACRRSGTSSVNRSAA